jgi:hypothetical protein
MFCCSTQYQPKHTYTLKIRGWLPDHMVQDDTMSADAMMMEDVVVVVTTHGDDDEGEDDDGDEDGVVMIYYAEWLNVECLGSSGQVP